MIWKKYSILTAVCIFAGVMAGRLFADSYFDALKDVTDNFIDYVINRFLYIGNDEQFFLITRIVIKRMGGYMLLWLFSLTPVCVPYIIWLCAKNGFLFGVFSGFMFMAYGKNAFIYLIAWYFPQYIIYIIVYLVTILYIIKNLQMNTKAVIITLSILLFAGCILEAYVNPIFMSTIFQLYS